MSGMILDLELSGFHKLKTQMAYTVYPSAAEGYLCVLCRIVDSLVVSM